MRQRAAVDEAIDIAGDAMVQVYGRPERPTRIGLERLCTEPPKLEKVVYHIHAITLTSGGFVCPTCGQTSEDVDGNAE